MSFSVIAPVKRCSDFARGITLEMEICLSAEISLVVASKGFKTAMAAFSRLTSEDERHQDRGYVVVFPCTSNKARGGVLNILKLL